ncbi:hypothetical protein Ddye_009142 [Dipteronia dyeriana]|uniref:Uncharacterized protein n=1 Tax=Dipteronia dyeriana TaxID=168575 RepID=A0AAD9XB31_9ROSI|nr:hypothetical protein Ddye_009142 [Dipteronia dyeriana]
MVRVPCKHLLIVGFLLLCFFISPSNGARSLGVTSVGVDDQKMKGQDVLDHQQVVKPAEENGGEAENMDEDLVSVDYTPARRKPPIHN